MHSRHFYYISSIFLIHCLVSQEEFTDLFESYNTSIWSRESGTYRCTEKQRMQSCAMTSRGNYEYTRISALQKQLFEQEQDTMLKMHLRNNCDVSRSECCKLDGHGCTEFTSGQFHSRQAYSHGLFLLLARMSFSKSDAPATFCFSLTDVKWQISMCFSSEHIHTVHIKWQSGESQWSRRVDLEFDPSRKPAVYLIEWKSTGIIWMANTQILARLSASQYIPNTIMNMKLSFLPLPSSVGYASDSVRQTVELYRVGFRHLPSITTKAPEHTELFVPSNYMELLDVKTFCIFSFAFVVLFCLYYKKNHFDGRRHLDGDELLLNSVG